MGKKISELPAAAGFDGTELLELVQAGANVKGLLGALLPPGYRDGLKLQWVSGNALTVNSGAAYIPSLGRVLRVPNAIAKTGLVLAVSTWYHVYLWLNGSNPDIEILPAAPSAVYNGVARTKSGDISRRYLGSVLTDGNGALWQFAHDGRYVRWLCYVGAVGFRPLSMGAATSPTNVSLAAWIPPTSTQAYLRLTNGATKGMVLYDVPNRAGQYGMFSVDAGQTCYAEVPTDAQQNVSYTYVNAPTGAAAFVDVFGYLLER